MATRRIQVPISDETRAALQSLADVQKCSLAAVCSEMLQQVSPVAVDMANALKMAQEAPAKALRMMSESLDQQMAEVDQYRHQHRLKLGESPKATRRKRKAG